MMTQKECREGPVEGDRFTLSEAADLLGICRQSLHDWLKRHGLLRRCPHVGRFRYVNVDILDRYREATEASGVERVASRPRDWVGIESAAEHAGCHPSLIYRAVERGEVRTARAGNIHYYCPEDLNHLRLHLGDTPLPGWLEIGAYAKRRGVTRAAATAWLKRHGHEIRLYRRTRDRRRVSCALETSLQAWAAASMRSGSGSQDAQPTLGISGRCL